MLMRPSISSPLSRRSTSGRMYPPPLPRCSAYSDRPACFDRERGVRGFPVVLHSGRDADVYGGRAGGMAVRRRICRCPVRRSRRGRGVVPCRKERPGFRCVSGPRRRDATYGAGGSIPESRGCLHGSLIGPSRFHAFRLMARPRGGRSLRRFCMVFRAAGGLCRRVG